MNTAWNRWCRNCTTTASGTAISSYNRITPIIITDITGRCNARILRSGNQTRIHIVQMTSLRKRPRSLPYFPSRLFHVPNPCILGTRPFLPCKNGSCCKLELVGTKSVFVLCYSCYLSAVGCSQVGLSYQ